MNAPATVNADAGASGSYSGPRDYRTQGRHAMFPETSHDECERFNYLAHMTRYIREMVQPRIPDAYELHVEPAFEREHGRKPKHRNEVRKALHAEPIYQVYSAFRRATMEQRQQAGRWVVLRQAEDLAAKAAALTDGDPRLELDPTLMVPRYLSEIDHHCMPGSYHQENFPGDVVNAANYDCGFFVTTGGANEPWLNGAGVAMAKVLKAQFPDFAPKRILDMGATLGHNAVAIAQAFPDAEVVAVDVGAPVLRYGLARAKSLGVDNIRFVQADATDLSRYADGSFDLVLSCILMHEISFPAMRAIFAESHRLLAPGGITAHADVCKNSPVLSLCEQALRDWDAFYNNEPFMSSLRDIDPFDYLAKAGFREDTFFHAAPVFERNKPDSTASTLGVGRIPAEKSRGLGNHMVGAVK